MRRGISIAMVIFGLLTVVNGIWKLFPPFNTMLYMPHVSSAFIFGILMVIHTGLNWKSVVRHFKGLRQRWVLVGLGFALIIWEGIVSPIIIRSG